MKEEPWKHFLNWGAVLMFLFMPILIMVIQLFALAFPTFLKDAAAADRVQIPIRVSACACCPGVRIVWTPDLGSS